MATYAVESTRQAMTATGIVEPVMAWIDGPDGKRRPSKDSQDHDAKPEDGGTGWPLWGVEVMYITESFGRQSTATAKVTVSAPDMPVIQPLTPITFKGLTVDCGTTRSGGFFERWRARELDKIQRGQAPKVDQHDKAA
ncbi:hypothetical protein [Jiangella gansuensis]|uniref:hypothetical protein n=1 Tax=Jiangella gansuensis TaxID=281473 RepID=UPI00047ED2A5|nr:hypothetical protein [Jiangella gansuensis]